MRSLEPRGGKEQSAQTGNDRHGHDHGGNQGERFGPGKGSEELVVPAGQHEHGQEADHGGRDGGHYGGYYFPRGVLDHLHPTFRAARLTLALPVREVVIDCFRHDDAHVDHRANGDRNAGE